MVNNFKPENININSKKEILTGSGFILNKGKWVITNKHIIDGSSVISVRNGLGIVRTVESIMLPQNDKIDLAILKLTNSFPSKFSSSFQDYVYQQYELYLFYYLASKVLQMYLF